MSDKDESTKCMHSAVDYLSRREHSVYELGQKLANKNYSDNIIKTTVASLIDKDYLSNLRYAEMLIRTRQQQGYGKRYIEQELSKKCVEDSIWRQIDEEINCKNAWQTSFEIAFRKKCQDNTVFIRPSTKVLATNFSNDDDYLSETKIKLVRNLIINKEKKRIMSYLTRRGFSFECIHKSLENVKFIVVDTENLLNKKLLDEDI